MKRQTVLLGVLLLLAGSPAFANVSEEEIQMLREQVRILTERLDELERRSRQTSAAATDALASPPPAGPTSDSEMDRKIDQAVAEKVDEKMAAVSWAERISWSGDFRYRYEDINQEFNPDRNRNRIRARAALAAEISRTMAVGIGLASGSDDPVSSNQTLGGGGSSKPLNLDLAYFQWTGLESTKIAGGKFKNDLYRVGDNGLVWDSDWRPEGMSLVYDNGTLWAVGLGTWVESDSSKSNQEFAYAGQLGLNWPLGDNFGLTAGVGYYHIQSAGKNSFYGDGDFFGNSYDPETLTYLYNYYEFEVFAQVNFDLFGRPTFLFGDYVNNLDPDDNNVGYAVGFQYGKAKLKGSWELSYTYEKLEADAVFGLLTNSDFGNGGTNARGSIISGAYAFHDNWNFQATYFINQINLDSGDPSDYDRLQLDLNFKFK